MNWEAELGPDERDDWDKFVAYQREHTVRAMDESAFVMSLIPQSTDFDIKFALETGIAVMMNKPILAVAVPGAEISPKLLAVCDEVIYVDVDTEDGRQQVAAAIERMKG